MSTTAAAAAFNVSPLRPVWTAHVLPIVLKQKSLAVNHVFIRLQMPKTAAAAAMSAAPARFARQKAASMSQI
jgi:hypothetical protein